MQPTRFLQLPGLLINSVGVTCYCCFSIAFLCFSGFSGFVQAADYRVIHVAVDNNFPPYGFSEKVAGETIFRGFNVDIIKAVALATRNELMIHPMPWSDAVKALEKGDVHAIAGMKYEAGRKEKYGFSEGFMLNSLAIFVQKNSWDIHDLNSLKGKRVAVYKNDVAYERLRDMPLHLVLTNNQEEALKHLLERDVDAVLGNRLTGEFLLQKNGRQDELKIVGGEIDPERYCFAVIRNDPLLAVFNEGLKIIRENGIQASLHAKWFGESIGDRGKHYRLYMNIALGFSFLILAGSLVVMAFNFSLKKEVRKRVRQIDDIRNYQNRLLNSGYGGILSLSAGGEIKFANDYAENYFSHESGTLAGKLYDETDFPGIFGERKTLLADTKTVSIDDRYIEHTCRKFPSETDKEETVIHFRDISEEYALRQEVARKDKMESLGKLLASIAHELRTPLTSIKTFVELLPLKYDNPDFRKNISLLVPQEVERLDNIIKELLAYSSPRPRMPEAILLKPLIETLMVYFEHLFRQEKITVILNVSDELLVFSDINHLKQILINILMNSIQALQGRERPEIRIYSASENEVNMLSICDNGPGMKQETVEKAFEPFYSLRPGGTGLGLFISNELARANRIDMKIMSESGSGTEIRLSFSSAKKTNSE